MLTIGAFAKACSLSPKALRLYDELDLLRPARVDPDTGYRYYAVEQLEQARTVAWLRRIGMPLARIREVCALDPMTAAGEIRAYWTRVETETSHRRDLAEFLVQHLTSTTTRRTPPRLRLRYAAHSDPGRVRPANQDTAYAGTRLLAVADGFGPTGASASRAAVGALEVLDARDRGVGRPPAGGVAVGGAAADELGAPGCPGPREWVAGEPQAGGVGAGGAGASRVGTGQVRAGQVRAGQVRAGDAGGGGVAAGPVEAGGVAVGGVLDLLDGAVRGATEAVRGVTGGAGDAGTTLTALFLTGSRLALVHIGDSRAYLLRDGGLFRITHDHTVVQSLIEEGRLTPEEATAHPQRALLLKALGTAAPDLRLHDIALGDRYLVCSDGLSSVLPEARIRELLTTAPTPDEAARTLIGAANEAGGPDNVSCAVADVVGAEATELEEGGAEVAADEAEEA